MSVALPDKASVFSICYRYGTLQIKNYLAIMSDQTKIIITTLGFLLAGVGFLALVLSIVGVKLSFLVWIDRPGAMFGFVARLVMIMIGFILVYVGKTDLDQEEV